MSSEDAWDALNRALQDDAPPCAGHASFTADSRTELQQERCASICARCPVIDQCDAYATAAKVDFGFWAGIERRRKK